MPPVSGNILTRFGRKSPKSMRKVAEPSAFQKVPREKETVFPATYAFTAAASRKEEKVIAASGKIEAGAFWE